ncbi:cation/multidrug efflux pump [Terriglobus roseus DSM 18391]|uniref:Cation/multidrug efflux pump n=1 Tax=Terriglobus roseus (strain DSM 18391 / NRRL B-41598 / KBS 63) TaxID=926566 RepID=I3ZHY4_TERRK|nr:efflux RND transporter permease subunit [Terriglobus roseus]AFL88852.1 cation/multidrug efflux pump [Terriglobus roseus DSM 18391]
MAAARESDQYWLARSVRTVLFLAVVLTIAGIYAFFRTPIAVFPETNFPRVVIGVDNGVMPVGQMQVTITKPIEDAVNSVPGLMTVRSTTSRGSAEVSLFFDWSVDMFRTLQLVDSALSKVQQTLPTTAKLTTNRLTFATFPILGYSLTSNTLSQSQLWELAQYTLKPPLNRVSGVSTVTIQGGQVPEFHVVPNMAKLQAAGVTILDLTNAIQTSNIIDSPGLYQQDHQLILALVGAQAHDIDGLKQLSVKTTSSGAPVRIGDVADVIQATMPVYTAVTADDQPAVLLNITRQPSSNTVAVADGVGAVVADLTTKLPKGVLLKPYYDQSQIVRESISSVRDAILIGLVLACIILYLFLRDWRSSLIAGLVIPVTVAATVLALWLIGESFNLMTLGGLAAAIGLVIDDAIVVVENIVLHRDSGQSRLDAVRLALKEIAVPLIGSTITPVVVFLPLVAVTGVTGSFFRALATTMTVSLLTSLVLAVSFTPGLALLLLKHAPDGDSAPHQSEPGKVLGRVMRWHHRALDFSLARPWALVGVCAVLVVGTLLAYRSLGSDLLPEMDEGGFIIDYIMPAGSSLQSTSDVLARVEQILKKTPEVESVSRRTGLQMGLAAVTEANTGDMTVKLKGKRDRAIDEVIAEVRAKVKAAEPQLDTEYIQVLQDNINDLSNAPEPIQIKLFSQDFALLSELAPRIADEIGKVKGVVSIENGIDNTISGPATNFQVDPQLAARLGFTPQEAAEDATSILDGVTVNDPVIANGRPYTVRVRLGDATRRDLDTIRDTVFNSASGRTASLGSLAEITQLPPQNEIKRENLQRLVTVTAQLEGTDLGTAVKAVQARVQAMHIPPSVRVEYGGTYEEQQKSFGELVRVLLLALILVFGVLLTEFRNFAAPIAILSSSVLSIAGVVGALLVTGTAFNVASFMGLIMVIGIVAKNGILLLDADERFRAEGMSALDAMKMSAQRRLRPILMTALAAVTGMLPLALAIGAGSQMLQPLAIAVIGGIAISMLLSLIVTPLIYYGLTRSSHDDAITA